MKQITNGHSDPLDSLHSYDDELGLLSCLLIEPDYTFGVCQKESADPRWFDDLGNRRWFEVLTNMMEAKEALTVFNIIPKFGDSDKDRYDARERYQQFLNSDTPQMFRADSYAAKLKSLYERRKAIFMSKELESAALDLTKPVDGLMADFTRTLEYIVPRGKTSLPAMIDASEFSSREIAEPQQVIHNVLYRGSKIGIGGGSKTFKTWNLLDLAFCVAHGLKWMKFQCSPGKVLYCNFEIQEYPWQKRLHSVAESHDMEVKPGRITLWNLRGFSSPHNTIIPKIIDQIRDMDFSLAIFDPLYKMTGAGKENAAEDMSALLNSMERVAVECNCAVAFGHHHSKGNQAGKEAIDRMSGSGVFGRDPDAIIDLSKHQEDGCFSVEPILRNFAPVEPFVVRWEKPRMRVDDDLDPKDLKQPTSGPKKQSPGILLRAIEHTDRNNPISISAWAEKLTGIIGRTGLLNYLDEFRSKGWISTVGEGSSARQFITEKGRQIIT